MKRYHWLFAVLTVFFGISYANGEVLQDWSEWSDWSGAGSCQGTIRPYARSRMCVEPSTKPSNIIINCISGDWEVEYTNRTASNCVQPETALILGVMTVVTLFCIVFVVVFTVLCVREWAKRKTYHVRQAAISSERMDNCAIYENISMADRNVIHDGGIPPLGTPVRDVADLRAKLTSLTPTVTSIKNECDKTEEVKEKEDSNELDDNLSDQINKINDVL